MTTAQIISNVTQVTTAEDETNTLVIVLLALLTAVVSLVTVFGNVLVLVAFIVDHAIRQPTNYFIASLALTDCLIGTFSMPLFSYYLLNGKWEMGQLSCDIWLSLDYTVCLCSQYTVFFITLDRYCSVKYPARYRNWRTENKVKLMVLITWVVPFVIFWPTIIGWELFGTRTVEKQVALGMQRKQDAKRKQTRAALVASIRTAQMQESNTATDRRTTFSNTSRLNTLTTQDTQTRASSSSVGSAERRRKKFKRRKGFATQSDHEMSVAVDGSGDTGSDEDYSSDGTETENSVKSEGSRRGFVATVVRVYNRSKNEKKKSAEELLLQQQKEDKETEEKAQKYLALKDEGYIGIYMGPPRKSSLAEESPSQDQPPTVAGNEETEITKNLVKSTSLEDVELLSQQTSTNNTDSGIFVDNSIVSGYSGHDMTLPIVPCHKENKKSSPLKLTDGDSPGPPPLPARLPHSDPPRPPLPPRSLPPLPPRDGRPPLPSASPPHDSPVDEEVPRERLYDPHRRVENSLLSAVLSHEDRERFSASELHRHPSVWRKLNDKRMLRKVTVPAKLQVLIKAPPEAMVGIRYADSESLRSFASLGTIRLIPGLLEEEDTTADTPVWQKMQDMGVVEEEKEEREQAAAELKRQNCVTLAVSGCLGNGEGPGPMQNDGVAPLEARTPPLEDSELRPSAPSTKSCPDARRAHLSIRQKFLKFLAMRRAPKKPGNRARKALRTISFILGAFIITWTPYHVLTLIAGYDPTLVPDILFKLSYWMCYVNSPLNPFMYALSNQQFKKTLLRLLRLDFRRL